LATVHLPGVDIDPERIVELALILSKSDQKAKNEIKEFVNKVEEAYNTFIGSIIPFYHITDKETFMSQFPIQYANFKKYFLTYDNINIETQRIKIEEVLKSKTHNISIKETIVSAIVPFYLYAWIGVNRYNKYKEKQHEVLSQKLNKLSAENLLFDNTVPETMNEINERFYEKFTYIYEHSLNSQNTQDSQRELKSFLSKLDDDVNVIRGLLDGLRIIRANL
jgi:hypothetical protein